MNQVALFDVPRPVLIVKKPTGVVYFNQVGGCGCYHKEQEGYLLPLWGIDPMEYRTFNHHVWYATYHAAEPMNFAEVDMPVDKLLTASEQDKRAWNESMWLEEVVEEIERLTGKDAQARDFIRMRVKKDQENYEAWVEVRALIRVRRHDWSSVLKEGVKRSDSKEWVDAILTWQNCD